jgi:hypothetical protein
MTQSISKNLREIFHKGLNTRGFSPTAPLAKTRLLASRLCDSGDRQ